MFKIDYPFKKEILACGAQEKANFCITKKNCAYVINDLGNLSDASVTEEYKRKIEEAKKELKAKPKVLSYDLHPQYSSTKYAQALKEKNKKLKCFSIQHHHAHIASCMAENAVKSKVIGVVFDGGAQGEDGHIWGGEFFVGDLNGFKRVAHLEYRPVNDVYTSSAARLFDEIAKFVGLRGNLEREGQGVVDLERIINRSSHVANKTYQFDIKKNKDKMLIVYPKPIFESIAAELKNSVSKSIISTVFHNTILEIVREVCLKIKQKEKIQDVILTGTVFQNKVLFNGLKELLAQEDFNVITHRHFSCNDSHISFGQAVLTDLK